MGLAFKSLKNGGSRLISIITCTIRDELIDNVFNNYQSQTFKYKELIIVLNKNDMNMEIWRERAKTYKGVSVYKIDEGATLGDCLNFGIEKATYDYIAKFDDDDFYGPNYICEAMEHFNRRKDISILGKNSFFVFLEKDEKLLCIEDVENDYVDWVAGATLVFKKEVWDKVRFMKTTCGEDYFFLKEARALNYKVYAGDRYNFVARRRNEDQHTWKKSNDYFLENAAHIHYVGDFRRVVFR